MRELLAKTGYKVKRFVPGEKIDAKFIKLNGKSASFDIGGKSEGVVSDIYFEEVRDFIKSLKSGDILKATVIDPEAADGSILLSLRQIALESSWEKLQRAKKNNLPVSVMVKSLSRAGLLVDAYSIDGFIPISQLGKKAGLNSEKLIGKHLQTKIIDMDRGRNKLVLSEKAVSEANELGYLQKAAKKIIEGEIYDGVVTAVKDFGAFVEVSVEINKRRVKMEGLVHISELAWEKVDNPADVVSIGDKVKVKAIGTRDGRPASAGRLAFSIRQAQKDPWEEVDKKYKVDTKAKGKIVRRSDFGIFVQLEPGIEGLVHMTKIPPGTKLSLGQELDCYVEEINAKEHRISLGLVLTTKPVGYK